MVVLRSNCLYCLRLFSHLLVVSFVIQLACWSLQVSALETMTYGEGCIFCFADFALFHIEQHSPVVDVFIVWLWPDRVRVSAKDTPVDYNSVRNQETLEAANIP